MNISCKIQPITNNKEEVVNLLIEVIDRIDDAVSEYLNSTPVFTSIEQIENPSGYVINKMIPFYMKDICLLGAITQATTGLKGGTDRGKTFLGTLVLNSLFGSQGEGFARLEINRSINIEDLIDIDMKKLNDSKLSEAISAAKFLALPARLVDEYNRASAKLVNLLLHIMDGTGCHLRGDIFLPVGFPYYIGDLLKRYSYTITTSNKVTDEYDGVFIADAAMNRRIIINLDMDLFPPNNKDIVNLLTSTTRRAKKDTPSYTSFTQKIITIYESMAHNIKFSPLASLFLLYLMGMGVCIRSKSGRKRTDLIPAFCEKCHLQKQNIICSATSGLTEGLAIWVKEIAIGTAFIRAAKVLSEIKKECSNPNKNEINNFLGVSFKGNELYDRFKKFYLNQLSVSGEDIANAYSLVAPEHLWINRNYLSESEFFENQPYYAFSSIAKSSYRKMEKILKDNRTLFEKLITEPNITSDIQSSVENIITNQDCAVLPVISFLKGNEVPLSFRDNFMQTLAS